MTLPGLRYNRRQLLGLGLAGCACVACGGANGASLSYDLKAVEVAPKSWAVFGAREHFSFANGGNIVNVAFVEVPDGVVVIDTGPSRRFGEALKELIARTVPGKPVLRVYNTHHHPDHFLGNQAFERGIIAAPQKVIDNIEAEGNGFADNMYRLVGDWMRGTAPVSPGLALDGDGEDVGGRRFTFFRLSGHTSADFAMRDDETGVLFSGDLAFLDRAPTTPHADLNEWRKSLVALQRADIAFILPGHGPLDPAGRSFIQTRDWLDWLDGTLRDALARGLTQNEAMALAIPARFAALGVAEEEYRRSVVHLWQRLEEEIFQPVDVSRD
ncbi:MAG: quinoprotein relay system zinc metallohydrolase 1 [Notoacmeibacter sp.]|nr:quinoprotein relay system zinc metallohydrolase 1 [Notoacmeibacter sp.]